MNLIVLYAIKQSVVMLFVIIQKVITLSVVMVNIIMLCAIKLSVVMLSVILMNTEWHYDECSSTECRSACPARHTCIQTFTPHLRLLRS